MWPNSVDNSDAIKMSSWFHKGELIMHAIMNKIIQQEDTCGMCSRRGKVWKQEVNNNKESELIIPGGDGFEILYFFEVLPAFVVK